jgi:hypothetical protein
LRAVLAELCTCGFAGNVAIGGSFVTAKAEPNDIDIVCDCTAMSAELWSRFVHYVLADRCVWHEDGVDVQLAHPELPRCGVLTLFRASGRPLVVLATSAAAPCL